VRSGAVLDGEAGGVDCRNGEVAAGDSGLLNGELRGEPYPRGDGLYEAGMA
jgi:hypothetical protein